MYPFCRVKNVKDRMALIPLAAHVDYWENHIIWKRFLEGLLR